MKKIFKEFEESGIDKEELKLKYLRGYELDGRFDKLVDKETKNFSKAFHDLVHLDYICFNLYGVKENISKYMEEWIPKMNKMACI